MYRDAVGDVWSVRLVSGSYCVAHEQVTMLSGSDEQDAIEAAFDQGGWDGRSEMAFDVVAEITDPDVAISVDE